MLKRLEDILKRYNELSEQMADSEVIADSALWTKIAKEHSDISEVAQKYVEYKDVEQQMNDSFAMAEIEEDAEMRDMLTQEGYACKERLAAIKDELKIMLLPKDKDDDKNVIMEIRGGVGGEEAALFAYELYRMYINYCERHRFRIEELDKNATELGGIKEVTLSISGKGAYSRLKYESGGHRVQRVPETESQGRVHTSACTVAVLPEAEEVDVELNEKDIRLDTYRSSGAGGQHINKTDSAIRLTHIPTGIVVTCQDERSQLKNKEKAYKLLRSRLYDFYNTQKQDEYAQNRKTLIGSGDRSERIRTYNFPQSRVTDHRIGLSLYDLDSFLMGDLDQMIDALQVADREAQLAGSDDIE